MPKQFLIAVVVAVSLSSGIGFGLGAVTRPEPADAATSNTEVVRQLKLLNTQLKSANSKLGTQSDKGTVRWLLTTICDYTASVDCGP